MNEQNCDGLDGINIDSDWVWNHMDMDCKNTVKRSENVQKETILDMPFVCTECDQAYSNKNEWIKHRTKHLPAKPFKCTQCPKRYPGFRELKRHVKIKHINKQFPCTECSQIFNSNETLERHMLSHLGYTCEECGFHCFGKSNFNIHVINIHKPEEKQFKCTECDFKAALASSLKYHMKRHTGDKRFICDICGNRFMDLCEMERHKWIHENKKPFECSKCSKKYRRKNLLTLHMLSHTGEKRFFCDECNFGSVIKKDLKFHMQTVHSNERPFECVNCGNKYKTKGNLTKHQNGSRGICRGTILADPD